MKANSVKQIKPSTRPLLRYFGGKWRLAPWVISFFPEHKYYVEPYGGAASVLIQKPPSFAEIYNDMDGEICNLFRVLRDPDQSEELVRQIKLTPFSRDDYWESYISSDDPIEQARRTVLRSYQGFCSSSVTRKSRSGFRALNITSSRYAAAEWPDYPESLALIAYRMRRVTIENLQALKILQKYDTPDTLFYMDPPYPHFTRQMYRSRKEYRFEMSDKEHIELAEKVHQVKGMVIISSYPSEMYDDLYQDGFRKFTRLHRGQSNKGGSKINTEVLYISENCIKELPLFQNKNGKLKAI